MAFWNLGLHRRFEKEKLECISEGIEKFWKEGLNVGDGKRQRELDFLFTADNDNHETGMANGTEGDLGIELNSGRRVNKASFVYNPKNTKRFLAAGSTIVVGRKGTHQDATIFEAPVFRQYTCPETYQGKRAAW